MVIPYIAQDGSKRGNYIISKLFRVCLTINNLIRSKQSFWVPGPEPLKNGWPTLKIYSKQRSSSTNIIFTIEVSGPDHMSLFIQPLADAKLVDWSFDKEPIQREFEPPYFIYFSYALDPTPLRFNLEFQVIYQ